MEETLVPQVQPDPPRVSVIIVTRNQARALRRCLEALHQATILDQIEIIVVDNASTDGSNVIQDDFEKVTYLKLPKNFGWTKAANIALRSSLAESILFLDPRVALAPEAIAVLAGEVSEESMTAAASAVLTTPDGAPARVMRKLPTAEYLRPSFSALSEIPSEPVAVDFPGAFALLIRKAFLKGMNFLDERYGEQWADAEISVQVKRAGRKILLLPAAQGTFYEEDSAPALPASLLEADFEQGAATYLSKHFGGGMGRRVSAALGALGTFKIGLFSNLVSGQKVDGSQE
ncbi:MAG TPA: glycosyltransferase family 2 protein [Bryobacteraceae bacterium]|nr:glycosyltransferase family 2 protein [Bryobacteraceae bacterium]